MTNVLHRRLRRLEASVAARTTLAIACIAGALGLHLLFPALPQLVLFLPTVLLASLLGGKRMGLAAIALTTAFAVRRYLAADGALGGQEILNLTTFLIGCALSVTIADRYQRAVDRLTRERTRLEAALKAARAAVWELSPDGKLYWDDNFYRLVGLDPSDTPPATSTFLEMIHPDDRPRLSEARRLMSEGKDR